MCHLSSQKDICGLLIMKRQHQSLHPVTTSKASRWTKTNINTFSLYCDNESRCYVDSMTSSTWLFTLCLTEVLLYVVALFQLIALILGWELFLLKLLLAKVCSWSRAWSFNSNPRKLSQPVVPTKVPLFSQSKLWMTDKLQDALNKNRPPNTNTPAHLEY